MIKDGEVWFLGGDQGRAQSATEFSEPLTTHPAPCSYNPEKLCCSYNATIGGVPMIREFETRIQEVVMQDVQEF